MKKIFLLIILLLAVLVISNIDFSSKKDTNKTNTNKFDYSKTQLDANDKNLKGSPNKIKEKPKQVIMKVKGKGLTEEAKSYVTTDYDSRLLTHPDSEQLILRIPKNKKLEVLESGKFQQGRMLNTWYKVSYNGRTGWTSSFNMKNPPQAVVTSVQDMVSNYEKKLGKAPVNDSLTGKIPEIVEWFEKYRDIKKIKYEQWYEPYPIANEWNIRVDIRENNNLNIYNFRIRNGEITSFKFAPK